MNIIVVGGGASGLSAAICRSNKGHRVTVIERAASCGKKLLTTGNGRCNYFNSDQDITHYHSTDAGKITEIISDKNLSRLKDFYSAIGLVPYIKDGYWYPHSQQAVNVLNNLVRTCESMGVKFIFDTEITDIQKKDGKFVLNDKFTRDKVILCTGSNAYYKKDKCVTYDILRKFGHTVYDVKPALVQMTSDDRILKSISGVRANVTIGLYDNSGLVRQTEGELQFTDYGISGICTMILSREYKNGAYAVINPVSDIAKTEQEFRKFFTDYGKTQNCTVGDILDSVMNYKLGNAVCSRAGVKADTPYKSLTRQQLDEIVKNTVSFRLNLTGTKGFDSAQTVSGGVTLREINTYSMESKLVNGLFICGEAIDLDGDCGGYNLTIAFLTGLLAGNSV